MEDWALIRHLHHSEQLSQRAIAKRLGIALDTVAHALTSDTPPKYQRPAVPSAISDAEPRIRALLTAYPTMPATVIAERIGWNGSITWLRERVRLTHRPIPQTVSITNPAVPSNATCGSRR